MIFADILALAARPAARAEKPPALRSAIAAIDIPALIRVSSSAVTVRWSRATRASARRRSWR